MRTEFHDKTGKPLYTGDVVQYRLSLNSKHGGPTALKLGSNKKGIIRLADTRTTNNSGWLMRKKYEQYITLIDTSDRER